MLSGRTDDCRERFIPPGAENSTDILMHLLRYVSNNPVNHIDPSGLAEPGMHWISQSVFKQLV